MTCVGGSHSLVDRGMAGQAAPVTHMSEAGRTTGSGLVSEEMPSIHNKSKRFMNS